MSDTAPSFDDLYAHAGFVRALSRALVRDAARADDLAQETWRTVLERPPASAANLRGWLGRVVTNLSRMGRRADARRLRHESAVAGDTGPIRGDPVGRLEVHRVLVNAVLALDEPYRTTVTLRYFQGLGTRAIADRTGVPLATVQTRLRRAHERLRGILDRDGRFRSLGGAGLLLKLSGGLIVTAKQKIAAGVAAALLLAGGAWIALPPASAPNPETPPVDAEPPPLPDPVAAAPATAEPTPNAEPATGEWTLHVEVRSPADEPAYAHLAFLDPDGKVVAERPTEDGAATLAVEGRGRLAVTHTMAGAPRLIPDLAPPASGERRLRVTLEEGLSISGTVLGADGAPLERVSVKPQIVDPPPWLDWKHFPSARTAANGSFRLTGLVPGRYQLRLILWRRNWDAGLPPSPLPVVAAGAEDVVIRLRAVSGVVLDLMDAETGEPVTGIARIYETAGEKPEEFRMVGDFSGPIEYRLEPDREVRLRIVADGYHDSDPVPVLLGPTGEGVRKQVRLAPDPGAMVPVTLRVAENGEPWTGPLVIWRGFYFGIPGKANSSWQEVKHERCDGTAEFLLPAGTAYLKIRTDEAHLEHPLHLTLRRGEPRTVDVGLSRGGALQVVHPDGPQGSLRLERPPELRVAGARRWRALAGGIIEYAPLAPGPVTVTFLLEGGGELVREAEIREGGITLVDGRKTD